jgi:predicted TIM-barrel fold metal-dependent hydrolase
MKPLPATTVNPASSAALDGTISALLSSMDRAGIAAAGFLGVKLHPEYQGCHIDDPALEVLYRALEKAGLIALFHAGHDLGFPDSDLGGAARALLGIAT